MNDVAARPGDPSGALREYWYVACTSGELPQRALHAVTVLGLGLVLYRRERGGITALLDQCLHRGTALSAGRLQDDCVTCPYHGWRYDADGRVVHIPSVDGVHPASAAQRPRQRCFVTRERDGLIWVYLGDDATAAGEPFRMPYVGDPAWVTYYMLNTFAGDVSALAQNFMDVPHTVYVHDRIFRKTAGRQMRSTVELTPRSVEVTYHDGDDAIGMLPWLTNPHGAALTHTDKFFAPNVTRCDYHWGDRSSFIITSQMTPLETARCRVYTLISYRFPLQLWLQRAIRPLIHLYTWRVIQQDVAIMKLRARGLSNAPGARAHSVEADLVHLAIERLIAASRAGEPLPPAALGTREMRFEI